MLSRPENRNVPNSRFIGVLPYIVITIVERTELPKISETESREISQYDEIFVPDAAGYAV